MKNINILFCLLFSTLTYSQNDCNGVDFNSFEDLCVDLYVGECKTICLDIEANEIFIEIGLINPVNSTSLDFTGDVSVTATDGLNNEIIMSPAFNPLVILNGPLQVEVCGVSHGYQGVEIETALGSTICNINVQNNNIPFRQWESVVDSFRNNNFTLGDQVNFIHKISPSSFIDVSGMLPTNVSTSILLPNGTSLDVNNISGGFAVFGGNRGINVEISLVAIETGLIESGYRESFSDQYVNYPFNIEEILPIDLIYFRYNTINHRLEWEVNNSENFSHFVIENLSDGVEFELVPLINGVDVYHNMLKLNNGVFRLKMIDFDESYSYSNLVHIVSRSHRNDDLSIYPNPVQKFLNIEGMVGENIEIFKINGRSVFKTQAPFSERISLDVSNLSPGVYFLKAGKINHETITRFIIK
jgi:hypothetical protein